MATKPTNSSAFLDAMKHRHSVYTLNDKQPISDSRLEQIVNDIALSVPSSFNTQTTRLVVLLRDQHREFWNIVKAVLRPHAKDEEGAKKTEAKLDGFANAFGTILFFEDPGPSKAMQAKFPQYAAHFPDWSEHTSAMHQFAFWTALEAEGFGANLQHYNPVVDIPTKQKFDVNLEWQLRAQLVFGGVEGEWPAGKEKKPLSETVKWFGKK
ncbi:MAG: hypothetical protein M1831_004582 [Alyxoria varia]|nr:MAG: hypothetical protein M1831_004582 [Alyxoria varia]